MVPYTNMPPHTNNISGKTEVYSLEKMHEPLTDRHEEKPRVCPFMWEESSVAMCENLKSVDNPPLDL